MDKILFIVPPSIEFDDFVKPLENVRVVKRKYSFFGSCLTDMPLGVMALSAYVKKNTKVKTKLVDFNVELNKLDKFEFDSFERYYDNFFKKPDQKRFSPNIIGISSLFTPSYQSVLDLAKCCHKIFPKAIIVAGGGVPTNMYKEIFKASRHFDALCYGEGEIPLLGLVKAKNKKLFLEKYPSWITAKKIKNNGSFVHNFIENLDEIPIYDYGLFKLDDYRLNSTISAYPCVDSKRKYIITMTSRGCPHFCCFCSSNTVHGRKMRYYSFERVKKDFEYLKKKYGIEKMIFQDDHFMADKQRALKILGLLKDLKMTAFFPNSLALYALDREVLEMLNSVGVDQIVMSIESGSERVLKEIMHKPLDLSIVRRVAKDCRELKIFTDASIIIGFPGETKKDIEDARAFLKTIDVNWVRFYTASPLVGSELYDICKKNGYIKKDSYKRCNFKRAVIETENFTAKYIQEKAYLLNLEINFVENSDVRLGNYEVALKGFENAIKAKSDHALAYYYASICYEKLNNKQKSELYLNKARTSVLENPMWRKYAKMFKVKI
ncbi:MAG: radical SAM protein [Patescibacteria group bacterium]